MRRNMNDDTRQYFDVLLVAALDPAGRQLEAAE
jgi:hypothetical protein